MKQIVIGLGQVGHAVRKVLDCEGYDPLEAQTPPEGKYDVMHICFPHFDGFDVEVQMYQDRLQPDLVVVHSTVPLGTCDPKGWVHSPIRGVHPDLELGIRTFVKFFGGTKAAEAAAIFLERNVKTMTSEKAATTEALKLWDTTQYGWNILLEKAIHAYCEEHGLDFDTVYTYANATYNTGYAMLGRIDVQRPVLKHMPGPIGGHCVRENWDLLDSPVAKLSRTLHKDLTGS